jgi:RNA polymerase I-specific transcription initiation factor RRN3
MKEVRFNLPDNDFPFEYESMTTYLQLVFKQKSQGVNELYAKLVDAFTKSDVFSYKQLLEMVRALSLFCTSLDHKVQPLVTAVLSIEWLNQDQTFINAYLHLLQNIVSAQSIYVIPVCHMLIQCIVNGQQKYSNIPDAVLFQQIHVALRKILVLIPSGPSVLLPLLTQALPHKSAPIELILFYVKSLLHLSSYSPILSNELINLIVHLIVQIDVTIVN